MLLLIALLLVSLALASMCGAFWRMSKNVGPLDLEDYARRNHVVFIPVSEQLAVQMKEPSGLIRIRLDRHRHPLLAELVVCPPDGTDRPG